MQRQMEQDRKRFGQATWATATPRLENLKLMLARETLQLMRAKELCLNQQRAAIQGKVRPGGCPGDLALRIRLHFETGPGFPGTVRMLACFSFC